ncbi:hypothetical protein [Lentibacillus sp. CBA3610]|nr:hypothetical protein [Lentibacillus sp. CBA3610]
MTAKKEKRKRSKDRGWLTEFLINMPELIVWPFKWFVGGILSLFKNWP